MKNKIKLKTLAIAILFSNFAYSDYQIIIPLDPKGIIMEATEYLTIDVVNNSVINSFNASELNITKGNSVVFNWDVTDSEGLNLNPYGSVSGTPTGSQSITFNNSGSFDFTLESTSLNGTIVSSTPIGINVYNPAVINSYNINGSSSTIDASPNDTLNFAWDVSDAVSYKLNGNNINGTTTSLVASSTTGTTQYTLEAFNGEQYNAGAVSNNTFGGYAFTGLFEVANRIDIVFNVSNPDGLLNGKQLYINGVRCTINNAIYDAYHDAYQALNCYTNLSSRVGQAFRLYME